MNPLRLSRVLHERSKATPCPQAARVEDPDRETVELELLLLKCRRGEPPAFEALVRRFERPLFYFIRRVVQNEARAWDVLQETWIRAFAGLRKGFAHSGLKAWLYRVARNTAINHVRDESRQHAALAERFDEQSGLEDSSGFCSDDAEEIHHALDRLDLSDREALTLYFLEDMSVREIAEVVGVPEGTVKSRLHFAKQRLRKILEKRNG